MCNLAQTKDDKDENGVYNRIQQMLPLKTRPHSCMSRIDFMRTP